MVAQKIRVLQLIDSFAMGGAERIVMMLAMHADATRFDIIPCALHRSGPLEAELQAAGLLYRVLGLQRRSVLTGPLFIKDTQRIFAALHGVLHEHAIDIVHAHLTRSTLFGVVAARRAGHTGVCATVHNVALDSGRGQWSPREWLMRLGINGVFSRADRIIGVSEEVSHVLRTSTRIPHERILTIPNGIDGLRFQCHQDRRELRQRLQLPPERPIVISVGRLTRQKGYPYLLDALALMSPQARPLMLIVGDGPDRLALEAQVAKQQLADDIRFLGNRSDVPALMAAANCYALASLWEGLPLVLLEAMASGLPVIATAVGANASLLNHDVNGLLIPAADAPALASALDRLLGNRQQQARLGKAAQEHFRKHYSLSSFIAAHENLYQEIEKQKVRTCHSPQV